MAQTKDLGPLYAHILIYPIRPKVFVERAYSQEIDGQYRKGYGIAVRMPFTNKAIVLGLWKKTGYTESEGLTYAIKGRGLSAEDKAWDKIRNGAIECSDDLEKNEQNLK